MIPRRVLDQPISNFPCPLWLREVDDADFSPTAEVVSQEASATDTATGLTQLVEGLEGIGAHGVAYLEHEGNA